MFSIDLADLFICVNISRTKRDLLHFYEPERLRKEDLTLNLETVTAHLKLLYVTKTNPPKTLLKHY